jgi:hypothetical protein
MSVGSTAPYGRGSYWALYEMSRFTSRDQRERWILKISLSGRDAADLVGQRTVQLFVDAVQIPVDELNFEGSI